MTPEQFCYWLQGFLEMRDSDDIIPCEQVKMVREHLRTVFGKVTPELSPSASRQLSLFDQTKKIC